MSRKYTVFNENADKINIFSTGSFKKTVKNVD